MLVRAVSSPQWGMVWCERLSVLYIYTGIVPPSSHIASLESRVRIPLREPTSATNLTLHLYPKSLFLHRRPADTTRYSSLSLACGGPPLLRGGEWLGTAKKGLGLSFGPPRLRFTTVSSEHYRRCAAGLSLGDKQRSTVGVGGNRKPDMTIHLGRTSSSTANKIPEPTSSTQNPWFGQHTYPTST